jgi:hypothetical protein
MCASSTTDERADHGRQGGIGQEREIRDHADGGGGSHETVTTRSQARRVMVVFEMPIRALDRQRGVQSRGRLDLLRAYWQ